MVAFVLGSLFIPAAVMAQTPASGAAETMPKTIGVPSWANNEVVPSLIVMNAKSASLQGNKLTLTGISPNSIMFADRPERAAAHVLTSFVVEQWAPGSDDRDSFAADPPNATVSAFSKDGATSRDAVVVLKTAKLEGEQLTFDVNVLEGDLNGADGPAAIFIDRFAFAGGGFARGGFARGGFAGGGFARGGFAAAGRVGVGRVGVAGVGRVGYAGRAAWYRAPAVGVGLGAAAVGGAALGAAAVAGAYNPYPYGAACGYYPYPPCY
jgi:hypothetical protein